MSSNPAAESKADQPGEGIRGFLVGCMLIVALGLIGVFPWARDLPYTIVFKFPYHFFLEIPAGIARFLPPGFPSEIAFRPPATVELPPNLKGVLISLVVTWLACLLFVILYAMRKTVPLIVRLAMGVISYLLLGWILFSICRWLFIPIAVFVPAPP